MSNTDVSLFQMETRTCRNRGCYKTFRTWIKSKQHICCIDCWEVTYSQTWNKRKGIMISDVKISDEDLSSKALNSRENQKNKIKDRVNEIATRKVMYE